MKKISKNYYKMGPVMQKVILLLYGGLALGLTRRPGRYFKLMKNIKHEWENVDRRALRNAINNLYRSHLVDAKDNKDGSVTITLTDRGHKKALVYNIDSIKIKSMNKWDGRWRIIIFDIPERYKKGRDALAATLKRIGFYRLQKSVFIHPFECKDEIDFIVEFWRLKPYVRFITTYDIDNDLHLRNIFKLN